MSSFTNKAMEAGDDTNAVENKCPEDGNTPQEKQRFRFSFRTLWAFTGPGWLMSIAYLDPGNIESDLRSGVVAGYKLLWILLWASVLGFVIQRLAARLASVTGKDLAQLCHENFLPIPNFLLWVMVEVAVIGSDMQEVIGTATAIYMLSGKAVPMWAGCLITIVDTFTFLFLDNYGRRKLEFFFMFLILTMAVTFGINYGVDLPDQKEVTLGVIVPWCKGSEAFLQAVGAVGALVMPHNFYLHSGLVAKNLKVDRTSSTKVREANFYTSIESAISIGISFIINLLVVSVFANTLHGTTNREAYETCSARDWYAEEFDCDVTGCDFEENVYGDLYTGGIYLGCSFGIYQTYVWAAGILASGQSSTMTGTYAGQFAMKGFLNLDWAQWKILVVTRLVAMTPTVIVLAWTDMETATVLNDAMNVVMSIQLPFALIPALCFTSSRFVMGEFANGLFQKILTGVIAIVVLVINTIQIFSFIGERIPNIWYYMVPIYIFLPIYFTFVLYLTVYLFICLGWESLAKYEVVQKIYKLDNVAPQDSK